MRLFVRSARRLKLEVAVEHRRNTLPQVRIGSPVLFVILSSVQKEYGSDLLARVNLNDHQCWIV